MLPAHDLSISSRLIRWLLIHTHGVSILALMARFVRSLLEQVAHEEEMIFPRKVLKTTANGEQKLLTTVDVERILIPVPY